MANLRNRAGERGAALVIVMLLVLMLSGVGAVVLLSAGVDTAVARNELWAERAAGHAEAGLELGKALLAAHVADGDTFEPALPPTRTSIRVRGTDPWGAARPADPVACTDPGRAPCRDYQFFVDERIAGALSRVYVGRVLRDVSGRAFVFDPRSPQAGWAPDLDHDGAPDVVGVTVWVRRPVVGDADAGAPDRVVLTSEARFPTPAEAEGPHAVSRLEMTLRLARRPEADDGEDDDYDDTLTNWRRIGGSLR